MQPYPPTSNRRGLIIVLGIVVVAIVVALIIFLPGSKPSATATPTPSSAPTGTQYLGTGTLLDQGATSELVDDLKFAIFKFTQSTNRPAAKAVTISNANHAHSVASNGAAIDSTSFDISIDQATYKGNLIYVGLTGGQLILKDPGTGAQVFDSGVVDVSNQTPAQ